LIGKGAAGLLVALAALARRPAVDAAPPAGRTSQITTRYDPYFRKYSRHYFGPTFDWRRFKAQAMAESGLNPRAQSTAGARGIMQLMPSTYAQIQSVKPHYLSIDDPQWNIAAGIVHDRYCWTLFPAVAPDDERARFMFGSYNAGELTIARAQSVATRSNLDPDEWSSIVTVAPRVRHWRYRETLGYVRTIDLNYAFLVPPPPPPPPPAARPPATDSSGT
jgi:membrane-bound lytic murein transglycosylase MltF